MSILKTSRSLYYNTLLGVATKVRNSELPQRRLEEILRVFFKIHDKAYKLFNKLKPLQPPTDELEELELLFKEFSVLLEKLSSSFKNCDWEHLFKWLEELKHILDRIFTHCDNMVEKEPELPASALSSSPFVNELIALSHIVLHENRGEDELKGKITFFREFLITTREQFSYIISAPDSVILQKESSPLFAALDDMEKALLSMMLYFEDNNKEHIILGIEKIRYATQKLVKIKSTIREAFFVLFHRFCLNCAYDNYTNSGICENCGSPLHGFADDNEMIDFDPKEAEYGTLFPRGLLLDSSILDIIYDAERMYFGAVSPEAFEKKLLDFERKISSFELAFSDITYPKNKNNLNEVFLLEELFSRVKDCIETLKEGVSLFRRYIVIHTKEDFLTGCRKIMFSGGFLHQIQDICEISERILCSKKVINNV